MVLGVPIFEHIIVMLLCAQILGHLKIINFQFVPNGKFITLGIPKFRHITDITLTLRNVNTFQLFDTPPRIL